jgi:hypothetical protein
MSQSRKHRGYRTEKVVAAYLSQWWSHAMANGAGRSGNDVLGIPFDIEIKARSSFQPKAWIDQVTKRSKGGESPSVVVCRMNGQGEDAEKYLAFMQLGDLVNLLLRAGYGQMQGDMEHLTPMRCNMCGAWSFKETCQMCEKDPDANL